MEKTNKKVIFVHPAIRQYRKALFETLHDYGCKLIFVEDYQDNVDFLKTTSITNYKIYKSRRFLTYSKGFTLRLLKDLFSDYDIWISSGMSHFCTHLALPFVKLRRKKFVLFAEDWWFSNNLKNKIFKLIVRIIVKNCDAIICTSTNSKAFFRSLGVDEKKIFIGFNATDDYGNKKIDNVIFESLKKEINPDNKFLILYLGRLVSYKGLDTLIRVFTKIENKFENVMLCVAGEGNFGAHCKDLVNQLNIKNIKFIGKIDQDKVQYYYKISNVFVLPARFEFNSNVVAEAWGFTINEALSCGIPVISTNAVASAIDLIRDDENGFVVNYENETELLEKLEFLISHQEGLGEFSKNAVESVRDINPKNQFLAFKKVIEIL